MVSDSFMGSLAMYRQGSDKTSGEILAADTEGVFRRTDSVG